MKKNANGFTIIEVVLVLAIAGLIFLAVFIARPALQRGQRDNQRRSDAARFASQLQSYATNNNGSMPANTSIGTFGTNYLRKGSEGFKSPKTGNNYSIAEVGTSGAPTADDQFVYSRGGTCVDEKIVSGTSPRNAAIAVRLEGSGVYCMEAQK